MEQQFPYLDERRAALWQRVRCSAIAAAAVEARRRSRPVRPAVTPCVLVLEGGGGERGRGGGRGDGDGDSDGAENLADAHPPAATACSQATCYKYLFIGLLLVPLVIFCNEH